MGADGKTLTELYKIFIRPILEYAAPLWDGSISKKSSELLESCQKMAVKIILAREYTDY